MKCNFEIVQYTGCTIYENDGLIPRRPTRTRVMHGPVSSVLMC